MPDSKKRAVTTQLAETRAALLETLTKLEHAEWETAVYSEDTVWTVADLMRHLTDAEASMTRLMQGICAGGDGVPSDFDLERWNASRIEKARSRAPEDLFDNMQQNRAQLLAFIDQLGPDDWSKKGRHGSLRIMSIEEICFLIADHEERHLNDIRTVVE